MSVSLKQPEPMTVDAFMVWAERMPGRWQLIDGAPAMMAPASRTHGAIQARVARVLGNHLDACASQCTVMTEPGVAPGVRAKTNLRVPDVAVVCPRPGTAQFEGPPCVVVEILSARNPDDIWANVWTNIWAYMTIPEVREILVLRPDAVRAQLLARQSDGSWPAEPDEITDGDIVLDSIAYRRPVGAFYPPGFVPVD